MYTYLIKSQDLYKIGKAVNWEERKNMYNTHNPYWELVYLIAGDVENALHVKFKNSRVKGEWFKLNDVDVEEIKKLPSGHQMYLEVDSVLEIIINILKNYRHGLRNLEKYINSKGNVLNIDFWNLKESLIKDDILYQINTISKQCTIKYDFFEKPFVHTKLYLQSLIDIYKKYLN